jgi:hypothetical protein
MAYVACIAPDREKYRGVAHVLMWHAAKSRAGVKSWPNEGVLVGGSAEGNGGQVKQKGRAAAPQCVHAHMCVGVCVWMLCVRRGRRRKQQAGRRAPKWPRVCHTRAQTAPPSRHARLDELLRQRHVTHGMLQLLQRLHGWADEWAASCTRPRRCSHGSWRSVPCLHRHSRHARTPHLQQVVRQVPPGRATAAAAIANLAPMAAERSAQAVAFRRTRVRQCLHPAGGRGATHPLRCCAPCFPTG